ncbi:MAG: hypothetical protein OCD01_11235 [Fibrobacterales bacterium]
MHIDRTHITSSSFETNERQVIEEMKKSTPQDRFALITYLRESFYGPEATTGRLQRVFEVTKFQ